MFIVTINLRHMLAISVFLGRNPYIQEVGLYMTEYETEVDPGGPVVIILASGSEVRGFDPGRGRWILSERKNPEYDLFRKEVKPWVPCRRFKVRKRISRRN